MWNPLEIFSRFKQWCLNQNITLRDKLVVTIGTMAILWYFASIIIVGFSDASPAKPEAKPAATEQPGSDATTKQASASADRITATFSILPPWLVFTRSFRAELITFMGISIATISGTLATYLGLVVGIGQVQDKARAEAANNPGANAAAGAVLPVISTMQTVAALSYVGSLVIALLFWILKEDALNEVVVSLARSVLGLFGGVLAVILNVEK